MIRNSCHWLPHGRPEADCPRGLLNLGARREIFTCGTAWKIPGRGSEALSSHALCYLSYLILFDLILSIRVRENKISNHLTHQNICFTKILRHRPARAGKIYLKSNDFLVLLCKLLVKFWKIQIFSKISIFSFFLAPVANFVTIFNLDKVYRRTIPFAWHYFRCFYFTEII